MKKSKVLLCWNISGILLLIAVLLNVFSPGISWIQWGSCMILILFVLTSFLLRKYLKCPHCGKFIHPKNAAMTYCPNCGRKINELMNKC